MFMPSPMQLLVILAIVLVLFGTKRIAQAGKDLGIGIKGFKDGIKGDEELEEQFEKVTKQATDAVVQDINKVKSKVVS